jgi:flagellar P-ring protein precursor FlgI
MLLRKNTVLVKLAQKISGKVFAFAILAVFLTALPTTSADASSRIKDIVEFEGVRDNMLVGYGLVVGLNGW